MILSYQWLQEWIHLDWPLAMVIERLTAAGIELESQQSTEEGDVLLEFKITPNRGDCLSVLGLARELSAVGHLPFHWKKPVIVPASIAHTMVVHVDTPGCPLYQGRLIEGISRQAQTPIWMQVRLEKSGILLNHPVVDVLNYVMLELGQPLHAFDAEKIRGSLRVRESLLGERLLCLGGQTLDFQPQTLIIADDSGPLAMAGVLGGADTGVTVNTSRIFLESAFFDPIFLSAKTRALGLQTEASMRFERGVDTGLSRLALERATALILEIVGGQAGPLCVVGSIPSPSESIFLRAQRVQETLGLVIAPAEMAAVLQRLGCGLEEVPGGWQVIPPSHRFDLRLEVDLIEEIGRVVGYDRLPPAYLPVKLACKQKINETQVSPLRLADLLIDRGYQEVITYSFVSQEIQGWADPNRSFISLLNPLTQSLACLRTQVWPSLVETWRYNRDRQQGRAKLFEWGARYLELERQETVLALLWAGDCWPSQWGQVTRKVDFFDLKGDIEAFLSLWRQEGVHYKACLHPALHPGQSAELWMRAQKVGFLGALHPALQAKLGLTEPVLIAEIQADLLEAPLAKVENPSKFPVIRRDLSVLVPQNCKAQTLLATVWAAGEGWVKAVDLFDVYQGKGISPEQKSVALTLTLGQATRTLVEAEVEACVKTVLTALSQQCGAILRE